MTNRKTRTEVIRVRVSVSELKPLMRAAKAADRDWPDWVRRTLKQAAAKGRARR